MRSHALPAPGAVRTASNPAGAVAATRAIIPLTCTIVSSSSGSRACLRPATRGGWCHFDVVAPWTDFQLQQAVALGEDQDLTGASSIIGRRNRTELVLPSARSAAAPGFRLLEHQLYRFLPRWNISGSDRPTTAIATATARALVRPE